MTNARAVRLNGFTLVALALIRFNICASQTTQDAETSESLPGEWLSWFKQFQRTGDSARYTPEYDEESTTEPNSWYTRSRQTYPERRYVLDRSGTAETVATEPRQTTEEYAQETTDIDKSAGTPQTTTAKPTTAEHLTTMTTTTETTDSYEYSDKPQTKTTTTVTTTTHPENTSDYRTSDKGHTTSTTEATTDRSSPIPDCINSDLLEAVVLDLSMNLSPNVSSMEAGASDEELMSAYSPLCLKFMLVGEKFAPRWMERVLGCKQSSSQTAQTVLSIFISAEALRTKKDNCKPKLLKFLEAKLVQHLLETFRPTDGVIQISFKPNKSMVKPIAFHGFVSNSGRRIVNHEFSNSNSRARQIVNAILLTWLSTSRDQYPVLSVEVDVPRELILSTKVHLMLDVSDSWNANEEPVNINDYLSFVNSKNDTSFGSYEIAELRELSVVLPTALRKPFCLCDSQNADMNTEATPATSNVNTTVCHYTIKESSNQISMSCYSNVNEGMISRRDTSNEKLQPEETVELETNTKPVPEDDRWPYKIEETRDVIRRIYHYEPNEKRPSQVEETDKHRQVTEYKIDTPDKIHRTIPRPPRPAHSGRIKKRAGSNLNPRMNGPDDRQSRN